jgi:hypothetical protein
MQPTPSYPPPWQPLPYRAAKQVPSHGTCLAATPLQPLHGDAAVTTEQLPRSDQQLLLQHSQIAEELPQIAAQLTETVVTVSINYCIERVIVSIKL